MNRTVRIALLVFLLLALIAPTRSVAADRKWMELRSANFLLEGDIDERDLRDVARRLEQFRATLSELLPNHRLATTAPTVVLIFANQRGYEPFKPIEEGRPIDAPGYFFSTRRINYVTMTARSRNEAYPLLFHEFAHLMLGATIGDAPPWFNEGMAEFCSTFGVTDDGRQGFIGRAIPRHVLMLRDKFAPLAEVLQADRTSDFYNNPARQPLFYAESWALVHYLLVGRPERTPQMFAFLAKLSTGMPTDRACQEAFGMTVVALHGEVQSYVGRIGFSLRSVSLGDGANAAPGVAAHPLSSSAVEARLGDLLLRMNRPTEAEKHLAAAIAIDPTDVQAQLSMGELRLREKKAAEALEYLRAAADRHPGSLDAQLAYGLALLERTGRPGRDQLAGARKAFARALELQPDSPDALGGLGWSLMLSYEKLDEAERLANRAIELAPSEPGHVLLLAQVLGQRKQCAAARERLRPLLASEQSAVRDQARAVMALLANCDSASREP